MTESRPESVLVIIHTPERQCLLLERLRPGGFWQSVTGTMRWDEAPVKTAAREVDEETGLDADGLVDAHVQRRFPILPEWRDRYSQDVTENLEHLWFLPVRKVCPITLNAEEHSAYRWLELEEAIVSVTSWTNREALERLRV